MATMSKQQYRTSQARLQEELRATQSALASMDRMYTGKNISMEVSEEWNGLHDYVWDIEQAMKNLERDWQTRNWTSQDWTAHQLILMNMD